MEMKRIPIYKTTFGIILLNIFLVACHLSKKDWIPIDAPWHVLMTLAPDFTIRTVGTTLNNQYLQLNGNDIFPMTGILRVDDKSYRFMGGDSIRIEPLFPLSEYSCGWNGRHTYLYPGAGWEQPEYNDSHWFKGTGAFGTEKQNYPVYTPWSKYEIYVRRYLNIPDKEKLKGRKLYIRYICDDGVKLFCNGEYMLDGRYAARLECQQLTQEMIDKLHEGNNVIAAHAYDKGGVALLDFGLYVESNLYDEVDTAMLKRVDMQTTQTHYVFQCGDVELRLDFVSPALLKKEEVMGCPVSFISYCVFAKDEKPHDVEILFDIDRGWTKSDSLHIVMPAEGAKYSCQNEHTIYSQNLSKENGHSGVLLLGYQENRALQYKGENLLPYWNRDGKKKITDVLQMMGDNYKELQVACDEEDNHWNKDMYLFRNRRYAGQVISSYRNILSSHRIVTSQDGKLLCFGNALGCIRDAYDCFPTLQLFNRTDLMKGLLDPIFETCESNDWVKKYPPYDIGVYPIVSRQVNGEDHSVEMAADMLMMTLDIVNAENDVNYADKYWKALSLWGDYLKGETEESEKRTAGLKAYHKLNLLKN